MSKIILDEDTLREAKSWEDLISAWISCQETEAQINWFRADIANKVETSYGSNGLQKFAQEVSASYYTLASYRRVARAFPESERNYRLSFSHYLVASMVDRFNQTAQDFNTKERYDWLVKSEDNNWSVNRLRNEIINYKKKFQQNMMDGQICLDYVSKFINMVSKWQNLTQIDREKIIVALESLIAQLKMQRPNAS